ncbi:hypothetical protein CDCA_CDCA12G3421 [Cyanidium caldarium]|uniref:Uncharacterized protein n=1 Tax=Cyanidium caldarium TaxID=2771 RepID=A0AAV9IZ39_CYACA|nr:hypothetical protein CDCA_CDCA12G3421 [Cyanidium caldarium]
MASSVLSGGAEGDVASDVIEWPCGAPPEFYGLRWAFPPYQEAVRRRAVPLMEQRAPYDPGKPIALSERVLMHPRYAFRVCGCRSYRWNMAGLVLRTLCTPVVTLVAGGLRLAGALPEGWSWRSSMDARACVCGHHFALHTPPPGRRQVADERSPFWQQHVFEVRYVMAASEASLAIEPERHSSPSLSWSWLLPTPAAVRSAVQHHARLRRHVFPVSPHQTYLLDPLTALARIPAPPRHTTFVCGHPLPAKTVSSARVCPARSLLP